MLRLSQPSNFFFILSKSNREVEWTTIGCYQTVVFSTVGKKEHDSFSCLNTKFGLVPRIDNNKEIRVLSQTIFKWEM